jgi:tRNA dimethylallyltransferase
MNKRPTGIRRMPKAFFLVGPTASGKSAVAQYIAEREGQLILSADSMNLYRGMDIGTAKPSAEERAKVDYAGIDLSAPTQKYSVAAYLDAVQPVFASGRDIIVAGGTGLYVKCLTEGFDDVPPENEALRTELEALNFEMLEQRAKEEASDLYDVLTDDDKQNPRRLIRILEKFYGGTPSPRKGRCPNEGSRPASVDSGDAAPPEKSWNSKPRPTLVGLLCARDEQLRRIGQRVDKMYADGLLDEARELIDLDLSPTALQAIGYAEAFAVLRNKMTLDEAKEKTVIRTRQLAKRQMTWFRNQLHVQWVDTAQFPTLEKLADAVKCEWQKLGATPVHF